MRRTAAVCVFDTRAIVAARIHRVDIEGCVTVRDAKARVCDTIDMPVEQMRLIYNAKPLYDSDGLDDHALPDEASVFLLLRLSS